MPTVITELEQCPALTRDTSIGEASPDIETNCPDTHHQESCWVTYHAQVRMDSRRISEEAVTAVLTYGRAVYARGAKIFALGRREVQRFAREGIDLSGYSGIQVVCSPDGSLVYTVFRNHNFRILRPRRRRNRHCSR